MDYRKFYDLENYLFSEVGSRFREQGVLSALDLYLILAWKANRAKNQTRDRLAARAGTFDTACQEIARALFAADSSKSRLRILMEEWNFFLPTTTAILAVLFPNEFTVYDVRVCKVLGNYSGLANLKFSTKLNDGLVAYTDAVRAAAPAGLSLRDCDKYLWGKSFYDQALLDAAGPNGELKLLRNFEGGCVFTQDLDGEFLLVVNQAGVLDALAPSERLDVEPEYTLRFKTRSEREQYARARGWWKR
jgi:hypothetical protein